MYPNNSLYNFDLYTYFKSWGNSPSKLIFGLLDSLIVLFILYKAVRFLKKTRAWQLLKGIAILVIVTLVSRLAEIGNIKYNFNYNYDIWCDYSYSCFCS